MGTDRTLESSSNIPSPFCPDYPDFVPFIRGWAQGEVKYTQIVYCELKIENTVKMRRFTGY
jgi:hypothetical protein